MVFGLASIADVPKKVLAENEKDQCQAHIANDLTRAWPRPGELLMVHASWLKLMAHGQRGPARPLGPGARRARPRTWGRAPGPRGRAGPPWP